MPAAQRYHVSVIILIRKRDFFEVLSGTTWNIWENSGIIFDLIRKDEHMSDLDRTFALRLLLKGILSALSRQRYWGHSNSRMALLDQSSRVSDYCRANGCS